MSEFECEESKQEATAFILTKFLYFSE